MATILSSFKEASEVLKDRGLKIDAKKVRIITKRYAKKANTGIEITETVAGCRVVISTDGGRIRIRKNKRGRRTVKGRKRYTTKWKEPKLIIIYTVNENGEKDHTFLPFINGTMKGPDAAFALIKFYLSRLEIIKALKILFVADGARWIWNRVPTLAKELGIHIKQFNLII